ncbi:MAG: DUF6476 family protein [Reyranellales bacterium]
MASSAQASAPMWLKVLVIVMGLLIVAGFVVVAVEVTRRMSTPYIPRPPAGPTFSERVPLPPGAKVVGMTAVGERLVINIEIQGGGTAVYVVDPRNGALLGTIEFPPGAGR